MGLLGDAKIELTLDVQGYFEQVVEQAIRARRVSATEAAAHYLAGLLSDYAHGESAAHTLEAPLTFQLRDALATRGAERFQRLRSIGDGVLYILGFFGQCLARRGADRGYVIRVGASAYGHASDMLRAGGQGTGAFDVLDELAQKYAGFVEVLSEVSDAVLATGGRDHEAVLRIYERWQTTRSGTLAEELTQLGLCPTARAAGVN